MLTDMHKERRAFMRMVIDAPVTLVRGQERIAAVCRDLSASGMAIDVANGAFKEGEFLRVSLATTNNQLPPFEAEARVIRADAVDQGYLLGVEFVSVG